MIIVTLKYIPINGVASEIGSIFATKVAKMVTANMMATPKDNFSPESGGRVKLTIAVEARTTHTPITL